MPSPAPGRAARDYALPSGSAGRLRRWRRRALACLLGADAAVGGLAAALGLTAAGDVASHLPAVLIASLVWPALLAVGGVFELRRSGHGSDEFRRVMLTGVVLLAVLSTAGLAGVWLPGIGSVQRELTLLAVPLATAGSLAAHLAGRIGLLVMRSMGRCRYRAVAVGQERSVAELIRTARRDTGAGLDVVGACLTSVRRTGARGAEIDGVPVLGRSADVAGAVLRAKADTVLISAWSDLSQEELRQLSWDLEGTGAELLVAPRLTGVTSTRLHVRTVAGSPLVHVREPELSGLARGAKAACDLVLAGLLLVALSPVLLALALAVRFDSAGPVLFRQERIGLGGRAFRMTKFRSMHVGADRVVPLPGAGGSGGDDDVDRGPLFKLRDDPRVTRVGRIIRRYSLDELPQLLDVVAGRMSLVGPRPQLPHEVAQYEGQVRRRLRVRPGMTGLWQVSGRSDLSWEDAVRLDLHYVENWSPAADLAIMARTVVTVLSRNGAY